MSEATSGVFSFPVVPAYRCAHAGYLLDNSGAWESAMGDTPQRKNAAELSEPAGQARHGAI
jgi:hypothetical protein